jgi:hypothetical protein
VCRRDFATLLFPLLLKIESNMFNLKYYLTFPSLLIKTPQPNTPYDNPIVEILLESPSNIVNTLSKAYHHGHKSTIWRKSINRYTVQYYRYCYLKTSTFATLLTTILSKYPSIRIYLKILYHYNIRYLNSGQYFSKIIHSYKIRYLSSEKVK